jgi:hypothetical protein
VTERSLKEQKARYAEGLPKEDTLYSDYAKEGNIHIGNPPSGSLKICLANTSHNEKVKCQFAFRESGKDEIGTVKKGIN